MKLKFWKREKKKAEITKTEFVKTYGQNVFDEAFKDTSPNEFKPRGITPTATIIDDLPHGTVYKLDGQCFGKLKSGVRCSRVVKNMYCYQHNRR